MIARSLIIFVAYALAFFTLAPYRANAQPPSEIVRPSLVYLKLEFTPTKGPSSGVIESVQSTGFLVSEDGFILTSYHLLEDVSEKGGADTVKVTAWLGDPQSTGTSQVPAAIVNGLQALDVLLLKIRTTQLLPHLALGKAQDLNMGDQIYTSGFNDTQPFNKQGTLDNKFGPPGIGYLWTLNMPVSAGESGSPVYLSDGTVIGILKGEDTSATDVAYMVPIEFADGLIAHLKLAELDRQVKALTTELGWSQNDKPLAPRLLTVEKGMQDVSKNFHWDGDEQGGTLVLTYHKLVAGSPQIKSIFISVFPYIKRKDSTENLKDNLPFIKDPDPPDQPPRVITATSDRGGRIVVPDFFSKICYRIKGTGENISISRVDVRIVSLLDDEKQTQLEPDGVSIDIDGNKYSKDSFSRRASCD